MKITVERCDEFFVVVPQIFDWVNSVVLWSTKKIEKKGTIKGYGSAAKWQPKPLNRNECGRFGALKSDSTHHLFGNACTKSGSLRFLQFSGCWLILSVYIQFWLSLWKIVRSSVICYFPHCINRRTGDWCGICDSIIIKVAVPSCCLDVDEVRQQRCVLWFFVYILYSSFPLSTFQRNMTRFLCISLIYDLLVRLDT